MIAGGSSMPSISNTSNPFNSGIWTSRNTKCGAFDRISTIAAEPESHSSIKAISESSWSSAMTLYLAKGSSSTTKTRIDGGGLFASIVDTALHGDCDSYFDVVV